MGVGDGSLFSYKQVGFWTNGIFGSINLTVTLLLFHRDLSHNADFSFFLSKLWLTKRASRGLTCHHSRTVVELLRKTTASCVTGNKIARSQGKCFLTSKRKGKTRAGQTKQVQTSCLN